MKPPINVLAVKKLKADGLTAKQIGERVGCTGKHVNRLLSGEQGCEKWEQERQDAIKFFNGLTPQQEYDLHSKRRAELKQQFEDEAI